MTELQQRLFTKMHDIAQTGRYLGVCQERCDWDGVDHFRRELDRKIASFRQMLLGFHGTPQD